MALTCVPDWKRERSGMRRELDLSAIRDDTQSTYVGRRCKTSSRFMAALKPGQPCLRSHRRGVTITRGDVGRAVKVLKKLDEGLEFRAARRRADGARGL